MQNTRNTRSISGNSPAGESIRFEGRAGEYFSIWVVNILLTICTLGIYSAWAKVRRQTYFYNRTSIQGYSFSYHASGLQILQGRMIALCVIFAYSLLVQLYPLAELALAPLALLLVPWIINAAMRFSRRMVSYRNVRFDWHGSYGKNMLYMLIGPLLAILTLGLAAPLVSRYYYRYYANSHAYGSTRFSANPSIGVYYSAFLVAVVLPWLMLFVLAGALFFVTGQPAKLNQLSVQLEMLEQRQLTEQEANGGELPEARLQGYQNARMMTMLNSDFSYFVLPAIAGMYLLAIFTSIAYGTLCRNLLLRKLELGNVVRFHSRVGVMRLTWISLTNLFLSVFSMGLLVPWCQIRLYRYLCDCTTLEIVGDMSRFAGETRSNSRAIGEGFADFEGLGLGI